MSDFGLQVPRALPLHLHIMSSLSAVAYAEQHTGGGGAGASITWVANLASFIPITVPYPYPVRRVFWMNGTTVTTTNADFGIYTATDGTRIFSTGSTTVAGTSQPQYVDVTDFLLPPGRYFFAYACDGTTNRAHGWTHATLAQRFVGIQQQSTALPLPATMASAGAATQALVPLMGVTRTSTGF